MDLVLVTGQLDLGVRHQVEDDDHTAARVRHNRLRGVHHRDACTANHIEKSEVVLKGLLHWLHGLGLVLVRTGQVQVGQGVGQGRFVDPSEVHALTPETLVKTDLVVVRLLHVV